MTPFKATAAGEITSFKTTAEDFAGEIRVKPTASSEETLEKFVPDGIF